MISITYIILTRLYFVHSLRRKFPSSLNPTNLNFSFILLIITLFSMSSIKIAINKYKVKGYTQFNNTHNIFTQVGSLSVYFFFHLKALHSFRRRLKKKAEIYSLSIPLQNSFRFLASLIPTNRYLHFTFKSFTRIIEDLLLVLSP